MLGTLDIFTGPEMRLRFAGYRVLDSVKFLLDHRLGYSCLNGFFKGGSFNFLSLNIHIQILQTDLHTLP